MIDYLLDDIDTVKLIAWINKYVNNIKKWKLNEEDKTKILSLIKYIDGKILKLDLFKNNDVEENIPEDIKMLAEKRWEMKKNKNFKEADRLRNEILQAWYKILDKQDGYEIVNR